MLLPPSKILIVDNRVGASYALNTVLSQCGYQVSLLANPDKMIEALMQLGPDLVLLEEELPGICGGQLCRKIKSEQCLRHIRVMMYSRSMRLHDPDYVQAIGADAALRKPCPARELLAAIEQQLAVAH
ncbi:response regulator [Phototrophicus methaneseepsis]|uniref:Response regulator n=1 Tax=Phototrophicus methaneseepsis TaxID=2710758 RepID=A0A7S8E8Z1_9CHLR|nr:response regulator [Phototrophicus methaneseepsis]QPC82532.1 response regulator [Phototrophicus methaneseepsis]